MRLPNAEQARVDRAKVVDYLLATEHDVGQHKARLFLRFGFTPEHWEDLAEALRVHAVTNEVVGDGQTSSGVNYVVDGILISPDGRNPNVRTVWEVRSDDPSPRLVTAYPA